MQNVFRRQLFGLTLIGAMLVLAIGMATFTATPAQADVVAPPGDPGPTAPPGPQPTTTAPDRDGDTVPDSQDVCPDTPGPIWSNGCPWIDNDGDGRPNDQDNCPNVYGDYDNFGCPLPTETPAPTNPPPTAPPPTATPAPTNPPATSLTFSTSCEISPYSWIINNDIQHLLYVDGLDILEMGLNEILNLFRSELIDDFINSVPYDLIDDLVPFPLNQVCGDTCANEARAAARLILNTAGTALQSALNGIGLLDEATDWVERKIGDIIASGLHAANIPGTIKSHVDITYTVQNGIITQASPHVTDQYLDGSHLGLFTLDGNGHATLAFVEDNTYSLDVVATVTVAGAIPVTIAGIPVNVPVSYSGQLHCPYMTITLPIGNNRPGGMHPGGGNMPGDGGKPGGGNRPGGGGVGHDPADPPASDS